MPRAPGMLASVCLTGGMLAIRREHTTLGARRFTGVHVVLRAFPIPAQRLWRNSSEVSVHYTRGPATVLQHLLDIRGNSGPYQVLVEITRDMDTLWLHAMRQSGKMMGARVSGIVELRVMALSELRDAVLPGGGKGGPRPAIPPSPLQTTIIESPHSGLPDLIDFGRRDGPYAVTVGTSDDGESVALYVASEGTSYRMIQLQGVEDIRFEGFDLLFRSLGPRNLRRLRKQ